MITDRLAFGVKCKGAVECVASVRVIASWRGCMQPPRCSLIVLPWHAAHVVDCSCTHASVSATHSHRLHFMADHEAILFFSAWVLALSGAIWRYLALSGGFLEPSKKYRNARRVLLLAPCSAPHRARRPFVFGPIWCVLPLGYLALSGVIYSVDKIV